MQYGIEVRNSAGTIITGPNDTLSVGIANIQLTAKDKTYTITSDLFLSNNYYIIEPQLESESYFYPPWIRSELDGNKLTITTSDIDYYNDENSPHYIIVGAY